MPIEYIHTINASIMLSSYQIFDTIDHIWRTLPKNVQFGLKLSIEWNHDATGSFMIEHPLRQKTDEPNLLYHYDLHKMIFTEFDGNTYTLRNYTEQFH
jgi:hypothetical protein